MSNLTETEKKLVTYTEFYMSILIYTSQLRFARERAAKRVEKYKNANDYSEEGLTHWINAAGVATLDKVIETLDNLMDNCANHLKS